MSHLRFCRAVKLRDRWNSRCDIGLSPSNGISSVQQFLARLTRVPNTHRDTKRHTNRQTDRQTTLRATFVAICRICALRACDAS